MNRCCGGDIVRGDFTQPLPVRLLKAARKPFGPQTPPLPWPIEKTYYFGFVLPNCNSTFVESTLCNRIGSPDPCRATRRPFL
jgi:hypothetical protein